MALTHYETLGVPRDASRAEISAAFRAQMRALHGDAGGDDDLAKQVSAAYNVLSHVSRRAAYDRTLSQHAPTRVAEPAAFQPGARRQVFFPKHGSPSALMLDVDPTAWAWHFPAPERKGRADGGSRRRPLHTTLLAAGFLAWALAGAGAATTLGQPLARIEALSPPIALLSGVAVHLVWSLLMITRALLRRWGLLLALLIAASAAVAIYLDAGTPLPMLGSPLCLLASTLTTYLSFGILLSRGTREDRIIDSSFITQVGSATLGARHVDIERLLGALNGAFGGHDGARVILLPDRVTPRPGTSLVRAQVAVIIGRSVHLIAIPPLGAGGIEVSGSEIVADGQVHRNVVHDEVQALRKYFGRGTDVHGYVIPTKLPAAPTAIEEVGGVSFASLALVLDVVGNNYGQDLDRPNMLFRHRAMESMALLL